jgi:hypothetical protein
MHYSTPRATGRSALPFPSFPPPATFLAASLLPAVIPAGCRFNSSNSAALSCTLAAATLSCRCGASSRGLGRCPFPARAARPGRVAPACSPCVLPCPGPPPGLPFRHLAFLADTRYRFQSTRIPVPPGVVNEPHRQAKLHDDDGPEDEAEATLDRFVPKELHPRERAHATTNQCSPCSTTSGTRRPPHAACHLS